MGAAARREGTGGLSGLQCSDRTVEGRWDRCTPLGAPVPGGQPPAMGIRSLGGGVPAPPPGRDALVGGGEEGESSGLEGGQTLGGGLEDVDPPRGAARAPQF
eukprot:2183441-Alexandrium_andersonii.AAC.1